MPLKSKRVVLVITLDGCGRKETKPVKASSQGGKILPLFVTRVKEIL